MSIVFHVMVGAGIAHVASSRLHAPSDSTLRRPTVTLIAFACLIALLSHGVLDGLKHGYPLPAVPDIAIGAALAVAWCAAARPPLRLLFAAVIAAALLPDVIDHGAAMLRWKAGLDIPVDSHHVFPWHWTEGSGSLHPGGPGAPLNPARNIDVGRNRLVSLTNHLIVLVMVAGCTLTSPWAVRFMPVSSRTRPGEPA